MAASKLMLQICVLVFALDCHRLDALCGVPEPRLVCAEAAHSQAVVTARLIAVKTNKSVDWHIYSMERTQLFRGQIPKHFQIYEGNDSGRADFDWKLGQTYGLFLFRSATGRLGVEACGNSAPMPAAAAAIKQVTSMLNDKNNPVINGLVSTDSWTTGLSNTDVTVSGALGVFQVLSDENGHFQVRVPAGSYTVTAKRDGWTFRSGVLSHENPDHLVLQKGTCAQVHLEGQTP